MQYYQEILIDVILEIRIENMMILLLVYVSLSIEVLRKNSFTLETKMIQYYILVRRQQKEK